MLIIPPALWATGGFGVVAIKSPLSLPSPRAPNPLPLWSSRVFSFPPNPSSVGGGGGGVLPLKFGVVPLKFGGGAP